MTLLEKQQAFVDLIFDLIYESFQAGYEITFGEFYRPPETAELYAKEGKGIADSLHCLRLAADLNLFKDGVFLTSVEDYKPIGELWKSFATNDYTCCWGGDFSTPDADHFSLEHNGIR